MERAVVLGSNNIYKDLFQNYTKELLPTWDVPIPLKLNINAALISIVSFVELEEKIITTMSLSLNWTDPRLAWNPSLYNNVYLLTLPPHNVWLPYLYLSNSVNDVKPIGQEANFYAIVTATGAVYWSPGGVFEAQCAPDVSNFPFDTQFCLLSFIIWGIPPGEVEYIINSNVPDLTYYYANSDWTLTDTQQSVFRGNYSSSFFVGLYIKRKPVYYVVTVILPTLLFCLMNPLIFCLPVESGERISLGMTILLAYAIFLTIVSASIPAKSDPVCIILLVLVLIMMISGVIVILTIKNIIAILKTKIPRERREARFDLEDIRKKSPDNLNVLADLEYIYTALDRSKDAEVCKQKYQEILSGTSKNDIRCKQICLLEQGYAIVIERTLINQSTVELRITDIHKILSTELERSQGRRKDCFERGIHHQIQVLRIVRIANEDETEDGHLVRKGSSLQKFKLAEALDASFPNIIWNYYCAKALNQYWDSLETIRKDHGEDAMNKLNIHIGENGQAAKFEDDLTNEMKRVTLKAIENFWMISQIQTDDPIVKTFVAMSYAYIGHILMKRGEMVLSSGNSFNFNTNKSFQRYTDNPNISAEMAYSIEKDDVTVLTRCGINQRKRILLTKEKSWNYFTWQMIFLQVQLIRKTLEIGFPSQLECMLGHKYPAS
ncbi:CHRNN [Mytilus coruscus]|uniref:CHRNN n=1 Tax=Mytilus coruscus TaxID=42192 RepID=A0A6J8E0K8_MYTCO|nr:CHRNN [Mytilus coruscus]